MDISIAAFDWVLIAVYMAAMVFIGWFVGRKSNMDSYLVAGRKVPYVRMLGTLVSSEIGGGAVIGMAGLGFSMGFSSSWMMIFDGLSLVVAALTILPIVKRLADKLKDYTLSDILGRRYDQKTRLISAIVLVLGYAAFAGLQAVAAGTLASTLLGVNKTAAAIVLGAIFVVYTAMGGLEAVIWTDFIQFVIIVVGVFFCLIPLGLKDAGGFSEIRATLPDEMFKMSNIKPGLWIYWLFATFPLWFYSPVSWQRIFAAKSVKTGKSAFITTGFVVGILFAAGAVALGLVAKYMYPDLSNPESAVPVLIAELLPVGITGLVIAAFLAILQSTADSCLIAATGGVVRDIWQGFFRKDADIEGMVAPAKIITLTFYFPRDSYTKHYQPYALCL